MTTEGISSSMEEEEEEIDVVVGLGYEQTHGSKSLFHVHQ